MKEELFSTFNSLDAAGRRIVRTVDLILNMAEIQTNSYQYRPTRFDLPSNVLSSLFNEFISSTEENNFDFKLICKNGNMNVFADDYFIKQIFSKLIDNAIKYTIKGFIRIEIAEENLQLVVKVIMHLLR
ncbi:MAG: histidine kinase [Ignavibacteriaceae bacterium]